MLIHSEHDIWHFLRHSTDEFGEKGHSANMANLIQTHCIHLSQGSAPWHSQPGRHFSPALRQFSSSTRTVHASLAVQALTSCFSGRAVGRRRAIRRRTRDNDGNRGALRTGRRWCARSPLREVAAASNAAAAADSVMASSGAGQSGGDRR